MTAPRKIHGRTIEQWDRMCRNKTRYADEFAARVSAQHALNSPPRPGRNPAALLWVYQCPNCRGWHMTRTYSETSAPVSATDLFANYEDFRTLDKRKQTPQYRYLTEQRPALKEAV